MALKHALHVRATLPTTWCLFLCSTVQGVCVGGAGRGALTGTVLEENPLRFSFLLVSVLSCEWRMWELPQKRPKFVGDREVTCTSSTWLHPVEIALDVSFFIYLWIPCRRSGDRDCSPRETGPSLQWVRSPGKCRDPAFKASGPELAVSEEGFHWGWGKILDG